MEIGEFLGGFAAIDLVLILLFMAFFVLGFAQGTIRRLIGLAAILFSFFFAANLAEPLGAFLGANWTQFAKQYSYMVGFGTVFIAAALAFAIVVQGFYRPQPLFSRARFVDEILGAILGVIQFGVILGATVIILDSFFRVPGIPADPQELPLLRDLWTLLDGSTIVAAFRESIIPAFMGVTSFLIPDTIEAFYPRSGR